MALSPTRCTRHSCKLLARDKTLALRPPPGPLARSMFYVQSYRINSRYALCAIHHSRFTIHGSLDRLFSLHSFGDCEKINSYWREVKTKRGFVGESGEKSFKRWDVEKCFSSLQMSRFKDRPLITPLLLIINPSRNNSRPPDSSMFNIQGYTFKIVFRKVVSSM